MRCEETTDPRKEPRRLCWFLVQLHQVHLIKCSKALTHSAVGVFLRGLLSDSVHERRAPAECLLLHPEAACQRCRAFIPLFIPESSANCAKLISAAILISCNAMVFQASRRARPTSRGLGCLEGATGTRARGVKVPALPGPSH